MVLDLKHEIGWNTLDFLHIHNLQLFLIDLVDEGLLSGYWFLIRVDSAGQNLYHMFVYWTGSQVVLEVHRLELEISLEHQI